MDEANKLNQHTRWNQGNLRESFLNFLDGNFQSIFKWMGT